MHISSSQTRHHNLPGGVAAIVVSFVPYNNGKPNQTHTQRDTLHTLLFSQSVSVKMCLYFFCRFQGRSLVTVTAVVVVAAAALRHDNYMYIHKKANKRLRRAAANKRTLTLRKVLESIRARTHTLEHTQTHTARNNEKNQLATARRSHTRTRSNGGALANSV